MKTVTIFDTTLRDGSQGAGISFTVHDKLNIAHRLDEFGIHYIEGGWPGSNPKDREFFEKAAKEQWIHARLVGFGSTHRRGVAPEKDENLLNLLRAETPAVAIFGKSWLLHAKIALGVSEDVNLKMIHDSVSFLKKGTREVIYDAEHFFDGYKDNAEYAIKTLRAAVDGGADILALCDTNGGTLPAEVYEIVKSVCRQINHPIGIHCHNDGGLAVANSLSAVAAGVVHVQGTVNGFGERCGNANLISIIPNLELKMGIHCLGKERLMHLTELSAYLYEVANVLPVESDPFVGMSAFAHKAGIHVSAFTKDSKTYEHIEPELVGNRRHILVSELSGKSSIKFKLSEMGITVTSEKEANAVIDQIKELENNGYCFETAEASLELLVKRSMNRNAAFFSLTGIRISVEKDGAGIPRSEATIRVLVNGHQEHTAAEGNGPVNALDTALRKALLKFFPEISHMRLIDYKVRVLTSRQKGTASKVRVLIESQSGEERWYTVGVSENIIEASLEALVDSFNYFLYKHVDSAAMDGKVSEKSKETICI